MHSAMVVSCVDRPANLLNHPLFCLFFLLLRLRPAPLVSMLPALFSPFPLLAASERRVQQIVSLLLLRLPKSLTLEDELCLPNRQPNKQTHFIHLSSNFKRIGTRKHDKLRRRATCTLAKVESKISGMSSNAERERKERAGAFSNDVCTVALPHGCKRAMRSSASLPSLLATSHWFGSVRLFIHSETSTQRYFFKLPQRTLFYLLPKTTNSADF